MKNGNLEPGDIVRVTEAGACLPYFAAGDTAAVTEVTFCDGGSVRYKLDFNGRGNAEVCGGGVWFRFDRAGAPSALEAI